MKQKNWITILCLFGVLLGAPSIFADEEYKNLKVLADNGETLEKGMKHFSKGLGVKCRTCHIKGKFESDEKPIKDKTRDFFRAVLETQDQAKRDAALAALLKELGRNQAKKPERLWKGIGLLKLKSP